MRETEFTDYTLREFELTSDNNVSVKTYHYFIPCLGIYNHVSDCSCEVTYCNKLRLQWDLNSFNIEGRGGSKVAGRSGHWGDLPFGLGFPLQPS